MQSLTVDGFKLCYEDRGVGPAVVLVAGSGSRGQVWQSYQVPALLRAGYRVVTFDQRLAISGEPRPTLARLASDVTALSRHLDLTPCRMVGTSLGSRVIQEVMLQSPQTVLQAVLMASGGRTDTFSAAMAAAERELLAAQVRLPPRYVAFVQAALSLSPTTWQREDVMQDWLYILEANARQLESSTITMGSPAPEAEASNRLQELSSVSTPVLVIGFQHDLIARPELNIELADALPRGSYVEISDCGHYGYLERPAAVNAAILNFFAC